MKKTYISPAMAPCAVSLSHALLDSSDLSQNGGSNPAVTPGEEEYDGTFNTRGWNCADWTEE